MDKISRVLSTLSLLILASLAVADTTGRLRGTVKDPTGKPIEKVTISIESTGEVHQKYATTTNNKGEFSHIGIQPGLYRITASKEGYTAVNYSYIDLRVALGDKAAVADFVMESAAEKQKTPESSQKAPGESPQHKVAQSGITLLNEGKVDQAIASFEEALKIDPSMPTVHYNLALAYGRKEQPEEAQKHLQEAIKLKPDFGEAYLALGDSYIGSKKFDAATEALLKATEQMPQSYEAFYNLGVAYSNQGKYAEAEAAYRKAAEISPKEPIVHYQLAMALLGQSKNKEAKAEFLKYLELNPNAADKQEVQDLLQTLQ